MESNLQPLEWHNEKRKVKDLVPFEFNPRKLSEEKKQLLINSIEKFNLAEVPAINLDNVIIAGHQRIKVLMELGRGEEEIDVRIPNRLLTEKEYKEYNITSNIPVGFWDVDVLEESFSNINLEELGLFIEDGKVVFDDYDNQEAKTKFLQAEEDDFDTTPPAVPITVLGDLYEIGEHRLLCGDSTQTDSYEKLFNGNLADLVVTDPPYNVDYQGGTGLKIMNDKMENNAFYQFLYDFYTALGAYTKQGGAWYVWHADSEGVNFRTAFQDSGLLLKQCLIWVKNALVMGRQDYQWKHEPCLYGWKEGAAHYFTNERNHTTVIEDAININKLTKDQMKKMLNEMLSDKTKSTIIKCDKPSKNDVHPTMKPILLLAPLIENSSKAGEIVADGFLGSGSTMVASHQLQRKCYGMELDPKYCDVIIKRMINLDANISIKRNGIDCKSEFL